MVYLCFAFARAISIFRSDIILLKEECSLIPYTIVLSYLHSTGLGINSLERHVLKIPFKTVSFGEALILQIRHSKNSMTIHSLKRRRKLRF